MKKICSVLLLFAFVLCSKISAQNTYQFTKIATITIRDRATIGTLLVTSDEKILLADWLFGLRAYDFDGSDFTLIDSVEINGGAYGLSLISDSLLFVASQGEGLLAYHFDGSSFKLKAHNNLEETAYCMSVLATSDSTIFVSNSINGWYDHNIYGLYAYKFDGTNFILKSHNDAGGGKGLAMGEDGTIFLANLGQGLWAYHYENDSLITVGHIDNGGAARAITIDGANTLFLANYNDGIRAYRFNDSSFQNTAHRSDSFGAGYHTVVTSDSVVFFANGEDGLRAYHYTGTTFESLAYTNEAQAAYLVGIGQNDFIFVVSAYDGLEAYKFSSIPTSINSQSNQTPEHYSLQQNNPNPFKSTTIIKYHLPMPSHVTLTVYDVHGRAIETLVNQTQNAGGHSVQFDGTGLVGGVYYCRLSAGGFEKVNKMLLIK